MNYINKLKAIFFEKVELIIYHTKNIAQISRYYFLEICGFLLLKLNDCGMPDMVEEFFKFLIPCAMFTLGLNLLLDTSINLLALALLLAGGCKIIAMLIIRIFFPDKK